MYPMLVGAVGYGVFPLIVQFEHVPGVAFHPHHRILPRSAPKEYAGGIGHDDGNVHPMSVSHPFPRIVMDRYGNPGGQTRQYETDDPFPRHVPQRFQYRFDGLPHRRGGFRVIPRHLVHVPQEIVAEYQRDLFDPPRVVRRSRDVNVILRGVGVVPQVRPGRDGEGRETVVHRDFCISIAALSCNSLPFALALRAAAGRRGGIVVVSRTTGRRIVVPLSDERGERSDVHDSAGRDAARREGRGRGRGAPPGVSDLLPLRAPFRGGCGCG
mmetsp:Transcript_39907/g.120120  ORF Transcript_39907/g.120120 Transcript_39907/m.120120 type:complete len:269 (+) Transcript_39907:1046-1852(+)